MCTQKTERKREKERHGLTTIKSSPLARRSRASRQIVVRKETGTAPWQSALFSSSSGSNYAGWHIQCAFSWRRPSRRPSLLVSLPSRSHPRTHRYIHIPVRGVSGARGARDNDSDVTFAEEPGLAVCIDIYMLAPSVLALCVFPDALCSGVYISGVYNAGEERERESRRGKKRERETNAAAEGPLARECAGKTVRENGATGEGERMKMSWPLARATSREEERSRYKEMAQ